MSEDQTLIFVDFWDEHDACLFIEKDVPVDGYLNDIDEYYVGKGKEDPPFLKIKCPCENILTIQTRDDFPRENNQCECGNFFVRYES